MKITIIILSKNLIRDATQEYHSFTTYFLVE